MDIFIIIKSVSTSLVKIFFGLFIKIVVAFYSLSLCMKRIYLTFAHVFKKEDKNIKEI